MQEGARRRQANEQWLAYYGGYFSGVFSQQYPKGRYPKFDKYAPKAKRKANGRTPGWRGIKNMVLTWHHLVGGETKKRDET